MDMSSWKKVLLQWINECGFLERNYFNIEQTNIDVFYQKFRLKHPAISTDKYKRLADFLEVFYGSFEINFDDENSPSSAEYIYVYSLFLHFCCVKQPETDFHMICQRLLVFDQQCIAGFFKELLETEPVTKEDLRRAIAMVGNSYVTPPRCSDSFSSSVISGSAGGSGTTSFFRCGSPLKTPKRCSVSQRISPITPKSCLLEERTKELYNLKAQLETERYEKGLLETQIKESENEIQKLNNDHKKLLQQIQDWKNEIFLENSESSTKRDTEENQIQKRLLKELSQKEQELFQLSDNARTLREEKVVVENNFRKSEKKIILLANRIKELQLKVEELMDEIKEKDDRIKYLADSNLELEQFISETRGSGAKADLNNSRDCLDNSFLRNSNNSNGSANSPENLGSSVVDVQLREKEHENERLKEELQYIRREHKSLAKHLTKLTAEFDLPIDITSATSSEDSESNIANEPCLKENSGEEEISSEEQFVIFNGCVEKIDKYHKTEKNKIKQLEEQTSNLQKENEELSGKIIELTDEIQKLKENLRVMESLQQEMENTKEEMKLALQSSKHDLLETEKQKNKFHNDIQLLQSNNDKLNENIQQLKTELTLRQQESKELLLNNKKHQENEENLQIRLQELNELFSSKTLKWEEDLKHLNEKLTKQFADIELYKQTEKTIKCNYEKVVVQNEKLKIEAREANSHLCKVRNDFKEKENQLTLLGKEIADSKQNNKLLETNIRSLMEEHKQELIINSTVTTDLDAQLAKLKDRLGKMELLMDSKQHECELKQRGLEEVRTEIIKVLKVFTKSNEANDNEDVLNIIKEMKNHIENNLAGMEDLNRKVVNLQNTLKETSTITDKLTEELKEKSHEFDKSQEELLRLQKANLVSEKKIAELQQQQICILERAESNLQEKDKELRDRLKEASSEYEASLERIAVELKLEKEHHNNKEIELILSVAEQHEAKKKLNEAEKEIERNCNRLKELENRVIECSEENDKLRHEIETFKCQVHQNALRLYEADKALMEYIDLTKEQESVKGEVEALQSKLKEKESALLEMELKVQQQSLYEDEIEKFKQQLDKQNNLVSSLQQQKEKLSNDVTRLSKDAEEKNQKLAKAQQEKHILLSSLEKSADKLKFAVEEKQMQKSSLEQQIQDLKEQVESMTMQNTKLQGDLVEREAELRLALDELQQEKEDFQQKLDLQLKEFSKKSEQLESMDIELMAIAATMENNFNLGQDTMQEGDNNVFNYQENESEKIIQILRKHLNSILFKQHKLSKELQEITTKKEGAVVSLATLKDINNDLLTRLDRQEKVLKETQEQLENEELIVEKRVFQEVKRLEEDLLNLEKVNERLANENVKIQVTLGNVEQELKDSKLKIEFLNNEVLQLKDEIRCKTLMIEKLQQEDKKMQKTLKEKCQQIEKMTEKSKHFETQLKDKTTLLQNLEKEYQETKEKAHKTQQRLTQCQHAHQNQQAEQKKLQEKLHLLQNSNDSLESELANKTKEILAVKNRNSDLLQHHKNLEQELNSASQKLDEMVTNKLNIETKCEQLQSEVYQLQRDLDLRKAQQHAEHEDNNRLNQEIVALKEDKQHLREEVQENKLSLQRANENVTQLIQQISSIRLEKEAVLGENILLRKQLEETGKSQTSSQNKIKSIIDNSQDLERKLLSAENEIKSLRANLEKSENSTAKLQVENKKQKDNQEVSTKRIEKLALRLGESQAKSTKLERENGKLEQTLKSHAATVAALQKEKDSLLIEAKALKERLSNAERAHEHLAVKVQNLEHLNTTLQKFKQKLESSEIDGNTKIKRFEKIRETNEDKLRKLTNSLNDIENANVKLNLEIGALNSQLQERSQQIGELNQKLTEAQELQHKYKEINENLKAEWNNLREENSSLNDKLSKASLSLQITTQKCERFAAEMEKIRAEMLIIRQEKMQIEEQHETSMQKINQFESQNTKIVDENKDLVKTLEEKIANLEQELADKSKKVVDIEKEFEILKEKSEFQNSLTHKTAAANLIELEDLRAKISLAEDLRLKDQQVISQLRLDNQILHLKYNESKQRVLDAAKSSEERIKENRLELEGKLEKMKNKMKFLYTEEIAKMKSKQDRETAVLKSEMEVLKTQNSKYEEHTRKLSNEIARLNDKALQLQKDNTMLSTKLNHAMKQMEESERYKRPTSIYVSTTSLSTAPAAGPNLAMEDEEGEVFNNTYLTDLENGRMSGLMSRDVCVEELKYRNSILPPHLRSTYAAQYDHEIPEEDLKDGPHSFDDSMSALLSTTAGGTRKKGAGVTHYKRPGPPTPSKNGGRLSFGGGSEPTREILKESYDVNTAAAVSSSKTPARFHFFSSRFSMGNIKDEKPKVKNSAATRRLLAGAVCTSTPRKSKVHFDQRRLLDQLIKSSPSPSPLTENNDVVRKGTNLTPPDINLVETPLTVFDKRDIPKSSMQTTIAKRLEAIAGGLKRCRRHSSLFGRRLSRRIQEICTPTSGETSSSALSTPAAAKNKSKREVVVVSNTINTPGVISKTTLLQKRLRKKPKKEIGARPSIYLRGNIFAKYRTPNKGAINDHARYKSHKQRMEHFNKCRNISSFKSNEEDEETDKTIISKSFNDITHLLKNNKYATFNGNKSLGDTVVVGKCLPRKKEVVEDTFTFGEEQFENFDVFNCKQDYDTEEDDSNEKIGYQPENSKQKELITSQELEEFDRLIAKTKADNQKEKPQDDYSSHGNSEHFEKILVETDSNAPFEIEHIQFIPKKNSHSSSHCSTSSHHSQHSSQSQIDSQNSHDHTSLTTPTPHLSPINPTCYLSRTIYGGTVIYNHRLPNINTTYVRKSSIYIKNRKRLSQKNLETSSANDVVLITNQTITFIDLMRMWSQMDSSTRIIICFAILASLTTLLGLLVSLCSRR